MSWIEFHQAGTSASGKTLVWNVVTKDRSGWLGNVRWYAGWRKYVFEPREATVFEEDCLREIATFCANRTLLHREDAKKKKLEVPS